MECWEASLWAHAVKRQALPSRQCYKSNFRSKDSLKSEAYFLSISGCQENREIQQSCLSGASLCGWLFRADFARGLGGRLITGINFSWCLLQGTHWSLELVKSKVERMDLTVERRNVKAAQLSGVPREPKTQHNFSWSPFATFKPKSLIFVSKETKGNVWLSTQQWLMLNTALKWNLQQRYSKEEIN